MATVQVQRSQDDDPTHTTVSREMFLSPASLQARKKDIEDKMVVLIEDAIVGDASRIEGTLSQISPTKKQELEFIAQVIVTKALDEPQHCKACVSLAGALQLLLPALPSGQQHKKGETFMHALLDVFQIEFEAGVCTNPAEQTISRQLSNEEQTAGPSNPSCASRLAAQRDAEAILAAQRNQHRIRAIVHLAGHLHCQGLLGKGVVSEMVHDLVDSGESEAANELLWFIGIVKNTAEQHQQLGTVLEDTGDSDGASSESISLKDFKERRPSCS